MKYSEALLKVESIARQMESGDCDIEQLGQQLTEARQLLQLCKDKLRKTDAELQEILAKIDE